MAMQNKKLPDETNKKPVSFNEGFDEGDNDEKGINDITPEELELLDSAGIRESSDDDELLTEAQLDDTDEDGDKLNENIDLTGADLDVPGSETDDTDEAMAEEDEENNSYSISDQEDANDGDV